MKQHEAGSYWGGIIKVPGPAFGSIARPDLHALQHRYPHQTIPGRHLRHHFPGHLAGVTPTSAHLASLQNLYTNRPHLNAKFMLNHIELLTWVQSVRTDPAMLDAEAYAVRVYCYCPETGMYQGEDFAEECRLDSIEGVTCIAPPVHVYGEVPVFDITAHCWNIIKLPKKRRSSPMDQS
ncbi:MAG: hypothetical protein WA003_17860 [Desulfuromonadaceae bacterium]